MGNAKHMKHQQTELLSIVPQKRKILSRATCLTLLPMEGGGHGALLLKSNVPDYLLKYNFTQTDQLSKCGVMNLSYFGGYDVIRMSTLDKECFTKIRHLPPWNRAPKN